MVGRPSSQPRKGNTVRPRDFWSGVATVLAPILLLVLLWLAGGGNASPDCPCEDDPGYGDAHMEMTDEEFDDWLSSVIEARIEVMGAREIV